MKRNNTFYSTVIFTILVLAFSSCCPEDNSCSDPSNPECENFDPCYTNPTAAGFKMRSTAVGWVTPENLQAEWCDTIFRSGVEFRADMHNAKTYTWYIGNESTPRSGYDFQLGFSEYTQDTLNLNPDNPDYYLPLTVTLEVRNDPGTCVAAEDTLLTTSRKLVFSRKTLTVGKFRGYVEGENFTRDVIFWQEGEDLGNPVFPQRYFSTFIGLPSVDTLRYYGFYSEPETNVSYKKSMWDEDWNNWHLASDGIRKWDQTIITFPESPDRVDLYYERIVEGSSEVEIVRFTGERIE